MKNKKYVSYCLAFGLILVFLVAILVASIVKNNVFNNKKHHQIFSGHEYFSSEGLSVDGIVVKAVPRSSTWTKVFKFENEEVTEHDYQAYTYDFSFMNKTSDEVSNFRFKLTFSQEAYMSSAWNGSLKIHQNREDGEFEATIPDLRDYDSNDYKLDFFKVDGETFVAMKTGDFFVYYPSSSMNAMEMPIKAYEGTTPGFIIYVPVGESIEDSDLEFEYTFYRRLTNEPLFWVSVGLLVVWLIALIIFMIISLQIRKYNKRHERDNIVINESIETFTGFIDAKDPYTNGHSKRVAIYTKRIAEELGFSGEELERIYYVALLHDCGKIGVPDNILRKPGKLTSEEFEVIKSHTILGGEILSHFKSLENVGEGALYHHERYDGKGYPEGRAGADIPLIARIICIADSYDAMNTNRVYRNRLPKEKIIEELEKNKGLQFDPEIADIMLRLLREGKLKIDE